MKHTLYSQIILFSSKLSLTTSPSQFKITFKLYIFILQRRWATPTTQLHHGGRHYCLGPENLHTPAHSWTLHRLGNHHPPVHTFIAWGTIISSACSTSAICATTNVAACWRLCCDCYTSHHLAWCPNIIKFCQPPWQLSRVHGVCLGSLWHRMILPRATWDTYSSANTPELQSTTKITTKFFKTSTHPNPLPALFQHLQW